MLIHHRKLRAMFGLVLSGAALLAIAPTAGAVVTGTTNPDTVADAIGTNTGNAFTFTVGPTQAGTGNTALVGIPDSGPDLRRPLLRGRRDRR